MLPLTLALYDSNDLQYIVSPERLRFTKSFYGGADIEMSFNLPLSLATDYPYVGYGQKAELWYGHKRLFLSEQREIEESKQGDTEGINVRALGYWVFLDDFVYGGKGKLWSDTRYDIWKPTTPELRAERDPDTYMVQIKNRIRIRPLKGEDFANSGDYPVGSAHYYCSFDDIKRITFDYDATLATNWKAALASWDSTWTTSEALWTLTATGSGSQDITLSTERPILEFFMMYDAAEAEWTGKARECRTTITNPKVYGSTDTSPTSSDIAGDIVDQIESGTPISSDKSLIETISLVLTPLTFEQGETCLDALKTVAFFGDSQHKLFGWGVESGGDRVFIDAPDYSTVRYIISADDAAKIMRRGTAREDYMTEGYGQYADEEGVVQYTDKYYAHVEPAGIVANTTSTGDDLASTVYGVKRDGVVDFGPMDSSMATEAIQQYLIEHGHPLITSSITIQGPVKDLSRGGAEIMPFELEPGHLVQIPRFRAVEAEGAANSDIRDWGTTFLLAGMEYDDDSGTTRLIPEEDTESLERLLAYSKKQETGNP